MFKKQLVILLSLFFVVVLLPGLPVYATTTMNADVSVNQPIYNGMEAKIELTSIKTDLGSNGSAVLAQDRKVGDYSAKVSVTTCPANGFTLSTASPAFQISDYSTIKLWIKPAKGATWIEFVINSSSTNSTITCNTAKDGQYQVGVDLISGQWNEVTLDLTKNQNSLTQVSALKVITNNSSEWYFDDVSSMKSTIKQVDLTKMTDSKTEISNEALQFKSNGTYYNVTSTTLYSNTTLIDSGQIEAISVDSNYKVNGKSQDSPAAKALYLSVEKPTYYALSGDGSKLYYIDQSHSSYLYQLDLLTGAKTPIYNGTTTQMVVNYDGSKVAFLSGSNYTLYLYSASTGTVSTIDTGVSMISTYSTSPGSFVIQDDGTVFYYLGNVTTNKYYLKKFSASGIEVIKSGSSSDGLYAYTNLACPRVGNKVFTVNNNNNLVEWDFYSIFTSSFWSGSEIYDGPYNDISNIQCNSDGTIIYFAMNGGYYSYQISTKVARKLDVPSITKVTNDKLFFVDSKFYYYDLSTDTRHEIVTNDAFSAFFDVSYDGEKIAYYNSGSTAGGINILNLNGVEQPQKYLLSFDGKGSFNSCKDGTWVTVKADTCNTSSATFTRSSVACKQDGTQVASGLPRYDSGLFSNGIKIEEATTNLLTVNQSSVETDTTGFTALNSATCTKDTTNYWQGSASLKVVCPGTVSGEGVYTTALSVSANTVYSGGAWVFAPLGASMQLQLTDGSDKTTAVAFTGTGVWQWINVTQTTDSHTVLYLQIKTATTQAITFYVDGLQIEQKAYATSWQIGGTARAAEMMTVPTAGLFTKGSWTIEMIYTPVDKPRPDMNYLWYCFISTGNYMGLRLNNGILQLFAMSGGTAYTINDSSALIAGTSYKLMLSGDGSKLRLYKNGSQVGSDTLYVEPVGTLPTSMSIGADSNDTNYYCNGIIDDLRFSTRVRTLAEHQIYCNSGHTIPTDYSTAATFTFDNTLNGIGQTFDFDTYGMTEVEINALTEADFASLYEDGRQIYGVDVALKLSTTNLNSTPSIKKISIFIDQGQTDQLQSNIKLFAAKKQDFTGTDWKKVNKIYPVEIKNRDAEFYYLIYVDGAYKSYKNNSWQTVSSAYLDDVETNWLDLTLESMTASEIRQISEPVLSDRLAGKSFSVVYVEKVYDTSTKGYTSMINIDYIKDYFVDKTILNITFNNGQSAKQYTLDAIEVQKFMEWLMGRQQNIGPIFYNIKYNNTYNDFINYYMIQNVTAQ